MNVMKTGFVVPAFLLVSLAIFLGGCAAPQTPLCGNTLCEKPLENTLTCPLDCGSTAPTPSPEQPAASPSSGGGGGGIAPPETGATPRQPEPQYRPTTSTRVPRAPGIPESTVETAPGAPVLGIEDLSVAESGSGIRIVEKSGNMNIAAIENVSGDDERLEGILVKKSAGGENRPFIIISNMTLSGDETKTVYLGRKNPSSKSVCVADADNIATREDILGSCITLGCPGELGGYKCSIDEAANTFVVSGLKHSAVIEGAGTGEAAGQGAPGNGNALCLYNSNSALSKAICDYYLQKRTGANSLGLAIPDSAFTDGTRKEQMNGPDFLGNVVRPLYAYIGSHPELEITHIAVAKDMPILAIDTEKYLEKGNDFIGSSPPKTVFASANFLLSMQGDYANATGISEYVLGAAVTSENGCVAPKPGIVSSRNIEYQKAAAIHFEPEAYAGRPYASNPRFAVSFLSGYTLEDIKAMIDRAAMPAPPRDEVAWVFDIDPALSFFDEDELRGFKQDIMESAGMPRESVFSYSSRQRPKGYPRPIVGYTGLGSYNTGYGGLWIAEQPAVASPVAARALMTSIESWNAQTMQGNTRHEGQANGWQGNIADAFAPNAFGGANYANSFSGAVGNAYEPTTLGTVPGESLFANYAAGLTFGESVLKSFRYLPNSPYSVHLAAGDPLMRAFDGPAASGRAISYGNSDVYSSSDITSTGGRKCYNQPASCTADDGTTVADGKMVCADDMHTRACISGAFVNETSECTKGCSLGQCVEDVFVPPNRLVLKKDSTYSIVVPVRPGSGKLSSIFRQPPVTNLQYMTASGYEGTIYTGYEWSPDVEIKPGIGMLLTPDEDYEVALDGEAFDSSVEVNIRGVSTLFGIPFCGERYTASQALAEIQGIEPRCKSISNLAKHAGTSPNLYWGSGITNARKANFSLNNYEAYYLGCEPGVDFLWKPSCNLPQPLTRQSLPSVTVSASPASVAENSALGVAFTFARGEAGNSGLRVNFSVSGTAMNGADYAQVQNAITIPAGAAAASLAVIPVNDSTVEPSETISVAVSQSPDYTIGQPGSATATILDDDTAANLPPQVSITGPSNNSTFTAPATLTISANASDSDGGIVKVEFYEGGTKLGEKTAPPYAYTWNNVAAGAYSFTAKATDSKNAATTSAPVTITVNAASSGQVRELRYSDLDYSDAGGSTEVKEKGSGKKVLVISNIQDDDPRLAGIVVKKPAPGNAESYTIVDGLELGPDEAKKVYVKRQGALSNGVCFRDTDNIATTEDITSGCTEMRCPGTIGEYTCSVEGGAFAVSGLRHSGVIARHINDPPQAAIASPASGSSFTEPATITLTATASDSDGLVAKVEFFSGTTKLGEKTSAPYNFTWANVPAGSYRLSAKATDSNGATATSPLAVITVSKPQNQQQGNQPEPENQPAGGLNEGDGNWPQNQPTTNNPDTNNPDENAGAGMARPGAVENWAVPLALLAVAAIALLAIAGATFFLLREKPLEESASGSGAMRGKEEEALAELERKLQEK